MSVQISNLVDKDRLLYFLQKLTSIFVRQDGDKVLSDNNYTTAEKTKLEEIEAGAEVNVITGIRGAAENDYRIGNVVISKGDIGLGAADNTSDLDKPVSTATQNALDLKAPINSPLLTGIPTAPTAASGTNTTQIATTAYVVSAIAESVGQITGFEFQVVEDLPETGASGTVYLVAHEHGTGDSYDEFIWLGSDYEKIGHTDIDLSGYTQASDITVLTSDDIDTIFDT